MGPKVRAIYTTARLTLLAIAFAAALRSQWAIALGALAIRAAIWWVALPHRRVRSTGRTFREHFAERNRETRREIGAADIALTVAKLPPWAGVPCRLILLIPFRTLGDRTANALLLRGRQSSGTLAGILIDGEADEREGAARALADLKPEGYESALRPLLDDAHDSLRAVAEVALGAGKGVTSDPFLRLIRLSADDDVPDDLVAALQNTWTLTAVGDRRETIRRLGERRGDAAVSWLAELIAQGGSESVWAVSAAKGISSERIVDALRSQARDPAHSIALAELVRRDDPFAEAIVLASLERTKRPISRGLPISFLARLSSESARIELLRLLDEGRGLDRVWAADALAFYGGNQEPLRQLAHSWNLRNRFGACWSLARLRRKPASRLDGVR